MPTITAYPSAFNSDYAAYSVSGTSSPIDHGSTSTSYATINLTRGSRAATYFYYDFDLSEIPEGSTIVSVTCSAKSYISTTSSSYVSTRQMQLYAGSAAKGSATTFSNSTSAFTINAGDWTWEELQSARIRGYAVRGTSRTTTNYYIRFYGATLTVEYEEPDIETDQTEITPGESLDYAYTGRKQSVYLAPGTYKLECWGAQGGSYGSYDGGLGGYSVGTLALTNATKLNVYVGGQPATNSSSQSVVEGGWNGGGNGQNRYYSSVYTYGQGGGGASDIRIDSTSLYGRAIVAGGGGGSASQEASNKYGGGAQGGSGGADADAIYIAGQTAPSTSGYFVAGTFGEGASAYTGRTNYQNGSGGGGGGWYGGYAYNYSTDSNSTLNSYNGGGSGYVYTASTAGYYPDGCLLDSRYYLTDAQTIGGNLAFPASSGGTETGHSGNGFVRITRIDGSATGTGLYFRDRNQWQEVQAIYRKSGGKWSQVDVSELDASAKYIKMN